MRGYEDHELDALLRWSMREFVPDVDPPPRVWEAIEAKRAQGVSSGEVGPLPWGSEVSAWAREALSALQALLLFLQFRLNEAQAWAEEQSTSGSVMVSTYGAPRPLYSYREATLHCWWSLTPMLR